MCVCLSVCLSVYVRTSSLSSPLSLSLSLCISLSNPPVNRTTAEHLLNANSNRSHCIFTVHITQRSRVSGSAKVLHSKLHLVDLAGSERIKKTLHDDDTVSSDDIIIKESMHINKSLSFLEQCVVALTSKSRSHVPYRQTKLTHVLKDSLGGNCKTVFIACIWGEARHMEETVSTLRLASRMMRVKNTASTNVEMDPVMLVKKYERQVRELKQELAMHDALSDQSGKVYDEYSPEQAAKVAAEVRAYLKDEPGPDGEPATLEVDSVRKMMEVLKQVKIVVRGLEAETEERLRAKFTLRERGAGDGAAAGAGSGAGAGAGSGTAGGAGDGGDGGDGVGVLDSEGFSMGIAAADARPATAIEAPAGAGRTMPPRTLGATESKFEEPEVPADKNKAFGMYRSDPDLGGSTAEALVDAKAQLKTCRADMKAQAQSALFLSGVGYMVRCVYVCGFFLFLFLFCFGGCADVNQAKHAIDKLNDELNRKRGESSATAAAASAADGEELVVDEEEYRLMKEVGSAKKAYKAMFAELRASKCAFPEGSMRLHVFVSSHLLCLFVVCVWLLVVGCCWLLVVVVVAAFAEAAATVDSLTTELLDGFNSWFQDNAPPEALGGADVDEDGDAVDVGEAFDRMQMQRITAQDPDSLAFHTATRGLALKAPPGKRVTRR